MPEKTRIIRVAIPAPLPRLFDYLCTDLTVAAGMRVRVPFGPRPVVGLVIETDVLSDHPSEQLKAIKTVIDNKPLLGKDMLSLCQWTASYYHHAPGEAYLAALPAALRRGEPARLPPPDSWQLTAAGQALELDTLKRAPRQQQVLARLRQATGAVEGSVLCQELGSVRPIIKALQDKGWIEQAKPPTAAALANAGPALSTDQTAVVKAVTDKLHGFHPCLLEGITGSGKTEVYIQIIRAVLEQDQQALVMVPEIALTPQLVDRFRSQLGVDIAVLHSGLTDTERMRAWLRAANGDLRLVIGTRSAIFTPLARPGVIIVDEEHDSSYKQQDGLRYSARDLAVRRAQMSAIPIVLGSATPSLESLHNAQRGRYTHLRLPQRAGLAELPSMRLIDIRRARLREGISEALLTSMQQHLDKGGQVMLFINRRGFAPIMMCHACGWSAECQRCDTRLTYHRGIHALRCHHCGSERRPPSQCPACNANELLPLGLGTERVEEVLRAQFRHIGIARIDRDTTRRKGSLQALLDEVNSQRAQILIGTQMLAKGHDFPHLSLVGVLDADGGLFGSDFRASEHMAQLITQVAGRAGRGERPGEVLIQTHHPDHPLLLQLLGEGYDGFANSVLEERQAAGYPPFASLALLRAEAPDADAPRRFLTLAANLAAPLCGKLVERWGPLPAPMERRAGRMRAQLLLQSRERAALHSLLKQLMPQLYALPEARKVRWSLDVDPIDML